VTCSGNQISRGNEVCVGKSLNFCVRNSCVTVLCVPNNVRFLWRAVLETRGVFLFMKDKHKMLNWRQFVLLILVATLCRFKTPYLFLFSGDWHEDHKDLGGAIICDRLFLAFYFMSEPTVNTTRSRFNQFWQQLTVKRWSDGLNVTHKNLKITISGLKTNN